MMSHTLHWKMTQVSIHPLLGIKVIEPLTLGYFEFGQVLSVAYCLTLLSHVL